MCIAQRWAINKKGKQMEKPPLEINIPRYIYADFLLRGDNVNLNRYVRGKLQSAYKAISYGEYAHWDVCVYGSWPYDAIDRFFLEVAAENMRKIKSLIDSNNIVFLKASVAPPDNSWVQELKEFLQEMTCTPLYRADKSIYGYMYKRPKSPDEHYAYGESIDDHALYLAQQRLSPDEILDFERRQVKPKTKKAPDGYSVQLSDSQKKTLDMLQKRYCDDTPYRSDGKCRVGHSIRALLSNKKCFEDILSLCKACNTMDYGFGVFSLVGFKF